MIELAHAKVNLSLYVGRPRPDGYHPIASIFQSISLADELTLEPSNEDEVICPTVLGPNLATRAIAAFREHTGWNGPPVRITIDKRIPVAAGLGGGSADAAATLRLLARHTGTGDIAPIAPTLGADVPFALQGGRARVTGIGEHVQPLPPGPPPALVLLPSEHTLSTPAVYAEADRLGTPRDSLDDVDLDRPHNDLQPAAISLCPEIEQALTTLEALRPDAALVSGSGPTVFGTFDDLERARIAAASLPGAILATPVT